MTDLWRMAKRSIKEMRRDELMDAAIEAIGEHGIVNATVAIIAGKAGMSAGLVNHYFDSKQELLALTLRSLSNLFRKDILDILPDKATPVERLKAIVDGSFAPQHFRGAKRMAWMQFMMTSQNDPAIRQLMRITGARFVSNIRYAVKDLVPKSEIDDVADGIAAIIDGFFWQIAADYDEDDFERARRICWNYVCLMIPAASAATKV
jgi:TetR/AcrR family transcriptional repressor of bet genes